MLFLREHECYIPEKIKSLMTERITRLGQNTPNTPGPSYEFY